MGGGGDVRKGGGGNGGFCKWCTERMNTIWTTSTQTQKHHTSPKRVPKGETPRRRSLAVLQKSSPRNSPTQSFVGSTVRNITNTLPHVTPPPLLPPTLPARLPNEQLPPAPPVPCSLLVGPVPALAQSLPLVFTPRLSQSPASNGVHLQTISISLLRSAPHTLRTRSALRLPSSTIVATR